MIRKSANHKINLLNTGMQILKPAKQNGIIALLFDSLLEIFRKLFVNFIDNLFANAEIHI